MPGGFQYQTDDIFTKTDLHTYILVGSRDAIASKKIVLDSVFKEIKIYSLLVIFLIISWLNCTHDSSIYKLQIITNRETNDILIDLLDGHWAKDSFTFGFCHMGISQCWFISTFLE